ncbi:sarcosine oxidase subunit gamma [Tepidamorphus sp. 3E244]|uniref:sarcosine oxidase subunit gamma n=1 Tax=Tepidamorphus sp. 3E244 TaxID=3385498 RepID=UPI0038FD1F4F
MAESHAYEAHRARDVRLSPLEPMGHRLVALSSGKSVAITEKPFTIQIGLRGKAGDSVFSKAVKSATGVALPEDACSVSSAGDTSILWLGPDEWLVVAPDAEDSDLLSKLESGLETVSSAVVDLTGNRTVIELSGPRARDVLEKGCRLDLHPDAFPVGRVAGTLMAHTQLFLEKLSGEPETFRLYVRASFARHMAEWLLDAMAEFTESA